MALRFVSVYKVRGYEKHLYALLKERPALMSISHRQMPSFSQHCRFVRSKPYKEWCFILKDGLRVGTIYLSRMNEIGIFLFKFHRHKKIETQAVKAFIATHRKLNLLANVSPGNREYARLFRAMGFKQVQNTYSLSPL